MSEIPQGVSTQISSPNFDALELKFTPNCGFTLQKQNSLQRIDSFGRILAESISGDPDILFSSPGRQLSAKLRGMIVDGDGTGRSILAISNGSRPPSRQDSEVPGEMDHTPSFAPGGPTLVPAALTTGVSNADHGENSCEERTLAAARQLSNLSVDAPARHGNGGNKAVTMKKSAQPPAKVVVPKHLQRPEYKYPPYTQKKQPTRDMKMFQNDEHFKEAMAEWKRKRALNNRSVRLCRERKQRELKELEIKCNKLQATNKTLEKNLSSVSETNNILLAAISNRKRLSPSEEVQVRRLIAQFKKSSGRR